MKSAAGLILFAFAAALSAQPTFVTGNQPTEVGPMTPYFMAMEARNLGPTNMGGRISQLAVYEKEPRIFYAATASGGLWRTLNGGITFDCVFQYESSVALGAVEINQSDPNEIWLGTGEENSRNSSSWGDGVYHSKDGGKTWSHMGLRETKHISKIILDPKNPNTVYVAALGHLWGENEERGVYKSTDAGKTWQHVLKIDRATGVVDMAMDPSQPNTLLAAGYQRARKAYYFASGGPKCGIYKTKDGGKTWNKITQGIPEGDIGRIGLSYFRKNPKVVVATIESKSGGTFRSTDGGDSWTKQSNTNPRPFYFSRPAQDPLDENRVYLAAVQFHFSDDQGKTFRSMPMNIHVDHHAAWINPTDSNHMIIGNDGGIAQTRDRGAKWVHHNSIPLGQFYGVAVDMRKPYHVFGGLQDNGSWGGPTQTMRGSVAYFDFYELSGGDGFQVQSDVNDWRWVYSESQGGALQRIDLKTGDRQGIRPRAPQGERYRFNWNSPIHLSPHNSKTIYFGGNKLFKSVDQGRNWKVISPDLSTQDPERLKTSGGVTPENTGAEVNMTIVTISESPMQQGVVWVGTDDGLVHLTKDDGATWTNVTANIPDLPAGLYVSRVEASKFSAGRCFVTVDGHRSNDYKPYVYSTDDFGANWVKISTGLKDDWCAYAIREGLRNPDLLILGTEMGLLFSMDRGNSWQRFHKDNSFPTVRVDDMVIHPRELDLVVGTHGRSIWIIPISGLEQLTKENREKDVFLCKPNNLYHLGFTTGRPWEGDQVYASQNTAGTALVYYHLKSETSERVTVLIRDPGGREVASLNGTGRSGMNRSVWRANRRQAPAGDYTVVLRIGENEVAKSIITVEDLSEN